MALIRQSLSSNAVRDAVVLDLGDLARQGELLKAGAIAKAEQIVREAHSERARILAGASEEGRAQGREAGRVEGHREGLEKGRAQAVEEFKARLGQVERAWTEALAAFAVQRERLLEGARTDVLDVALMAAEKVVKRALRLNPGLVADQVGAVIEAVARPTESRIAIHPDDEPLVREAMPALRQRLEAARHVSIETDPSLERGSCILRTPGAGEIDATVRTQLDRIVEALLPERDTRNPKLRREAGGAVGHEPSAEPGTDERRTGGPGP